MGLRYIKPLRLTENKCFFIKPRYREGDTKTEHTFTTSNYTGILSLNNAANIVLAFLL